MLRCFRLLRPAGALTVASGIWSSPAHAVDPPAEVQPSAERLLAQQRAERQQGALRVARPTQQATLFKGWGNVDSGALALEQNRAKQAAENARVRLALEAKKAEEAAALHAAIASANCMGHLSVLSKAVPQGPGIFFG